MTMKNFSVPKPRHYRGQLSDGRIVSMPYLQGTGWEFAIENPGGGWEPECRMQYPATMGMAGAMAVLIEFFDDNPEGVALGCRWNGTEWEVQPMPEPDSEEEKWLMEQADWLASI